MVDNGTGSVQFADDVIADKEKKGSFVQCTKLGPQHIMKATRVFVKPNLFSTSPGRQTYKHTATEMAAVRCFFSLSIFRKL